MEACAGENYNFNCNPVYPIAGPPVEEEINPLCIQKNNGEQINRCPRLYEWLGRLKKYKKQLEVCNDA